MNYTLTNGSKIGYAKVISNDLVPKGASVCGRKLQTIGYITLHNTGLVDVKANNFHRSLKRENALSNGRQASWTYTVDDIEIYQETPDNWETWHAGNSTGNKNSISIEMTMWSDKEKQRRTYDNSARLVAQLMKKHKISIDKVVQHNKWSGKNCPEYLRAKKHGYDWNWFIALVKKYYSEGTTTNTSPSMNKPSSTPTGQITVVTDVLNVRKGAGTNYDRVGQVKKGEVYKVYGTSNGWYALDNGKWVSGDKSYVTFKELGFEVGQYDGTVIVTAEPSLSHREERNPESTRFAKIPTGTKLNIWTIAKGTDGNLWGSCRYNGQIGYVCMKYVKEI